MPKIRQMPNGDWVRFPDDESDESIQAKIDKKFGSKLSTGAADLVKGAAKGVVGLGVGAAQIGTAAAKAAGVPVGTGYAPLREAARDFKKWAASPSSSGHETVGRILGEGLPFAFQPEMGVARLGAAAGRFGLPTLGRIAENAIVGGEVAGLQPQTEKERATSELGGAAAAGTLAAVGGIPARIGGRIARHMTAGSLAALLQHHFGYPLEVAGLSYLPLLWEISRSPLGALASRAGAATTRGAAGAASVIPPALLGGLVGEGVRSKDQ
jgi:hypothetical protein